MDLTPEVRNILEISRKAGELLKKLSLDPQMRKPRKKGDGSPVTAADLALSQFLVTELKPLGYPVISEEALPDTPPGPNESYFLIDPVDGTKYFARGEDEFAICIGLLKEGKPWMGVIFDPSRDHLFWAVKGQGAYRDEEKITHPGVGEKLKVYSSGFHKKPGKEIILESLGIGEIREKGSALKFCDIATGEMDLYMRFGNISEWDTAAAQVILEEAGCSLLEWKTMDVMKYGKVNYINKGVIAGHKSQMEKVKSFLKQHGPFHKKEDGV